MLKTLRQNTKSMIWVTIIIFVGFTVVGSALSTRNAKNIAGSVFGKKISYQTYKTFYDIVFYSPRFQNLIQKNADLPETFIANTTMQYIALHTEAKRNRITASDNEVRDELKRRYSIDGVFNSRLYEMHVANVMRKKPRAYEESLRKEIRINKLIDALKNDITISETEAREAFDLENSKYTIAYTAFAAESYTNLITVDESILETYYNENKSAFVVPEKYDFNYLTFSHADFTEETTPTEYEIEEYYNKNIVQFTDPVTGDKEPLSEVNTQITGILAKQKARSFAFAEAKRIQEIIQDSKNFELGSKKAERSSHRTGFKTSEELMDTFGWTPDFYNKLDTMSPNSLKTIQSNEATFVVLLTEKEYSFTPIFSDIINSVRTHYIEKKSRDYAQETAQEHFDALQSATETFEEYLSSHNLSSIHIGPITATEMNSTPLGTSQQLLNTLRNYTAGDIAPPYDYPGGYALIYVSDVEKPSHDEFAAEKDAITERLLSIKSNQVVSRRIGEILKRAKIQNNMIKSDDPFADIK